MGSIFVYNGSCVFPGRIVKRACIEIRDGKIVSLKRSLSQHKGSKDYTKIDARGSFVSPGFIDTHVHGEPQEIFDNETRFGTTSILPTISCVSLEELRLKAKRVKRYRERNPLGANVLGLRLEGPFINKLRCGAQDTRFIEKPSVAKAKTLLKSSRGLLKIIAVAPEVRGASSVIKLFKRMGVVVSLGHSDASYKEALGGVEAGISHATHTFNCMKGLDRREPGCAGEVLVDRRVTSGVILDLVHVHKALFKILVMCKGIDNMILVTDSVVSGPPRSSKRVKGAYRFSDGTIAGSCLTMNRALKNAVREGGLSIVEAVRMLSLNPARLLSVDKKKGSIEVGKDADVVIFDRDFDVKMTMMMGKIVYYKEKKEICAG